MEHSLTHEITERGFVYQFSGESLEAVLDSGEKRTVFLGIDPTADAIHVGHLVPYLLLNHILKAGHRVILLLGGATALIGDPSGKDEEREFVDVSVVKERCAHMEHNIKKIAVFGEVQFVNNYDWLSQLSTLEFLRDVGKHFTVNALVKKESVARRLESESGISFTEFSYSLLQGYDFYHLYKEHNCTIQIGGSDQWGNITAGVDYIRRKTGAEVYGLTLPLVVDKTTGKKFGKSEGNAVWLDPEKTSPYAFYQFWLNTSDENVIDYLKLFTFLPLSDITEIETTHQHTPGKREAQRALAYEVTAFVHGSDTAAAVRDVSTLLFEGGDITTLSPEAEHILTKNAPIHEAANGQTITDVLVGAGLATSKREAREFVTSGAVTLNGELVTDTALVVEVTTLSILRRGKKQLAVLQP